MKKAITKLLWILLIPIILGSVNLYVDSSHIFDSNAFLNKVVTHLYEGKNIANIYGYDDRILQKKYIERLPASKDIIVLGSSQILFTINGDFFPDHSFFNNGVGTANIQDYLAIFNLYEKYNRLPKVIIIGIDPWILNKNREGIRWQSLTEEYNQMLSKLGKDNSTLGIFAAIDFNKEKVTELFSTKYFIESIKHFNRKYFPTDNKYGDTRIRLTDGSVSLEKAIRERSIRITNHHATNFGKGKNAHKMGNFKELDKDLMDLLDSFIQYLLNKKINVILFQPPFHPISYQLLLDGPKFKLLGQVDSFYHDLSVKIQNSIVRGL